MTTGAMPRVVPRLRLARNGVNEDVRMQVQDAGGLRVRHDGHARGLGGQARDPGVLAQDAADALDGGLPRRMASEKQTVRLIDVGCGRSHITTCIPAR